MKPGYKTTEFWLTLITNAITTLGAVKGAINPNTAAIVLASLNGIYGVLRTVAKQPDQTTPPQG